MVIGRLPKLCQNVQSASASTVSLPIVYAAPRAKVAGIAMVALPFVSDGVGPKMADPYAGLMFEMFTSPFLILRVNGLR